MSIMGSSGIKAVVRQLMSDFRYLDFDFHNLSKVVFMTNQLGKIGKMHYDLTNTVQKQLLFFFKTTYGRSQ